MINVPQLSERPLHGIIRNLFYGIFIGIALWIFGAVMNGSPVADIPAYLIVGNCLSFFGWGAEQLWLLIISPMVKKTFSWYAYLTRIPFWYIAGGIGYTFGMLFDKKMNMITFADIPVKSLFSFGGQIEIFIQLLFQIRIYKMISSLKSTTLSI